MKVLFFIHNLRIGGAETLVAKYLIKLKERGVDVVLVEENREDSSLRKSIVEKGIKIYTLFESRFSNRICRKIFRFLIPTSFLWKKIVSKEKPDVVHLHTNLDNYCDKCFPAKKTVYTFHSNVQRSLDNNSKKNERKIRRLSHNGMFFVAISHNIVYDIKKIIGTDNIVYIPNGVDFESIRSMSFDCNKLKDSLSIPQNAHILGHVGRFDKVKNHERIIEIFSELLRSDPNWYLLLIGGGGKDRVNKISSLAKSLNVSDQVRMLGVRNDATQLMGCFDAMIHPSFSESFSLVLVEAQAHGVPCIASTAVPAEVFCNENCTRLSLDLSNREWAECIEKTYRNDNIDEKLNLYSINSVVSQMEKFYCDVCKV